MFTEREKPSPSKIQRSRKRHRPVIDKQTNKAETTKIQLKTKICTVPPHQHKPKRKALICHHAHLPQRHARYTEPSNQNTKKEPKHKEKRREGSTCRSLEQDATSSTNPTTNRRGDKAGAPTKNKTSDINVKTAPRLKQVTDTGPKGRLTNRSTSGAADPGPTTSKTTDLQAMDTQDPKSVRHEKSNAEKKKERTRRTTSTGGTAPRHHRRQAATSPSGDSRTRKQDDGEQRAPKRNERKKRGEEAGGDAR